MDQILPVTNSPQQSFQVSLSVDGGIVPLELSINYSEMAGYWVMTVSDQQGNLVLDSIPLTTGTYPSGNVLGQYGYLGIGACYVVNASGVLQDYPDSTNLGTDFLVVWGDTA